MRVIPVPCSFDNYSYVLICEQSHKAAIVDPTEAYPLVVVLEENGVVLTDLFCTHHHHDHVGGAEDLRAAYPTINVVCYRGDRRRIPVANSYVDHDDKLQFGELSGQVLHTPGHTTGSISYMFNQHLFVGDTLFGGGCGRLFEGTPEQMHDSLNQRLAVLAGDTRIYFGHEYTRKNLEFALTVEPDNHEVRHRLAGLLQGGGVSTPSTIALEKSTNPFLRVEVDNIKKTLQTKFGIQVNSTSDVFTQLRRLRDAFA